MVPLTPDQSKKSGVGVTPSPAPFLTPRPERRRTDSRGSDSSSNHHQNRDKEVNIQVVLRCRWVCLSVRSRSTAWFFADSHSTWFIRLKKNLLDLVFRLKWFREVYTTNRVSGPALTWLCSIVLCYVCIFVLLVNCLCRPQITCWCSCNCLLLPFLHLKALIT